MAPSALELSVSIREKDNVGHATKNQEIVRLLSAVVQTRPVLGL